MPRHPGLDLEHFLPYRLSVLSNRISQAIAAATRARRFGIGVTEWRVIAVLGRYPGLSAGAVAARTAMDKVAVSRAVARLLERELVERDDTTATTADARCWRSAALDGASTTISAAGAGTGTAPARALDRDERAALDALLDKLADGIEHLADAPP